MPHWNGLIDTESPAFLEGTEGDPERVLDKLRAEAPQGTSVLGVRWVAGESKAIVTVAGPTAEKFLREELEAKDVVKHESALERKKPS
jgi:hypothetical protein